jgi:hypothetical protein
VSARFRPAYDPKPRVARWRRDPPPGMRASTYYGAMLAALPKSVGALVTANVFRLVRQELGSDEAVAAWLVDVVKRRGAPVMVNVGTQTIALGPDSSQERLLGHIGVMHEALESEFGPIARVYRPETAA